MQFTRWHDYLLLQSVFTCLVLWPFPLFSFIHTPQSRTPQSNSASTPSHSLSFTHTHIVFSQISLSLSLSSLLGYGFASRIWLAGSSLFIFFNCRRLLCFVSFSNSTEGFALWFNPSFSLFLDVNEVSVCIISFV